MATPRVSAVGREVLVAHEGVVLKAYRCPAGIWTIGVGHTSAAGAPAVKPGMTITRDEALDILERDLATFEERTARHFEYTTAPAPQAAFDGGASFDFNTGRIHNASWPKLWNRGDKPGARASLMRWTRGGGKVLRGLVRRREDEARMIFEGAYPAKFAAPAHMDVWAVWVVPSTPEQREAFQAGLKTLGYDVGQQRHYVQRNVVEAFQRDHDLTVDGKIGPATLSTLQRELDARRKTAGAGAGAATGGATAAGGPAAVEALPPEAVPQDVPEALLDPAVIQIAGLAILALAAARGLWLAWRYRDVVAARVQGLAPRAAAWLRSF